MGTKKTYRLAVLGVLIAAVLSATGYAYYRYWGPTAWLISYEGAARGTDEMGHPWIGSAKPSLVIHEYLDFDCPHCSESHKRLRLAISEHIGEIRLVRHDYARMKCAPNDSNKKFKRCELVRGGYCAGKQGKYWEYNDAIIGKPRPLKGPGMANYLDDTARSIGLNLDSLENCLFQPQTIDYAQYVADEARSNKIKETPSFIIDGKLYTLVETIDLINERF